MAAKTRHKVWTVKIQHCPISSKFDMWVDNDIPTLKNFYRSPFSKWPPQYSTNSTLSDFNEIWYVGRLWCPELIPDIEKFLPFAIFKMATTIPQNIKLRICHNAKCAFKPVVSGRFGRLHNHYTIIILPLSFFCQKFVRHISQRLLNGNQWNFTGMLSTMSRCADYFLNFQNGRHCHGNAQNAKKLKNTKMIIAGYSQNRNWWNL